MTNEQNSGVVSIGDAAPVDSQSLASSLAPNLVSACNDQLSDVRWFRTDWQRGGAATARARLQLEDGSCVDVIIKIPVGTTELRWTRRLQSDGRGGIAPRLYFSGDELGSYDLGWMVLECLPYGPLGAVWQDDFLPHLAKAAAQFARASAVHPIDVPVPIEDWHQLIADARESIRVNQLADASRWQKATKKLDAAIDDVVDEWRARPVKEWVHGDLHPANALARGPLPDGAISLIDLAQVRPGHWVEDAVYLERLFWAHPEHIKRHKPVRAIADARKALDLDVSPDDARLATIRRVLLAATAPRFMKTEGSPIHLAACLSRLESGMAELRL